MRKHIAYSIRAAAVELRIPRALLSDAVRMGALKSYRVGNQMRLVTEDILVWLRSLPAPPPKHRKEKSQ
jgi:excisionase family DNA binding protein